MIIAAEEDEMMLVMMSTMLKYWATCAQNSTSCPAFHPTKQARWAFSWNDQPFPYLTKHQVSKQASKQGKFKVDLLSFII